MTRRYVRSASQLRSVTACGERFRLERLTKAPPSPAAWTALGVGLHQAFCEWEQQDRKIDVCEYFEKSYDAYIAQAKIDQPDLDKWMLPPGTKSVEASIKNYRKRGLEKDVPLYRDRCLEAEWEIYRFDTGQKALELEFEIVLGSEYGNGVPIRGAIDRIQWWPQLEMVSLEDTKTGNLDEWDARQLGVYAFAANRYYNIPVKWGRYWFTKLDRGGDWIDLSRYTFDYVTSLFVKLDSIIDQDLLLPNPGKHCQLCGVRSYCREFKEI